MKESVIYQSIKQEGLLEGKVEAFDEARIQEASLLIRIIKRHLGGMNLDLETAIKNLSFSQLEALGESFLDWNSQEDLVEWLKNLH